METSHWPSSSTSTSPRCSDSAPSRCVCVCFVSTDVFVFTHTFGTRICPSSQRAEAARWSTVLPITGFPERPGTPMTRSITSWVQKGIRGVFIHTYICWNPMLRPFCWSFYSVPGLSLVLSMDRWMDIVLRGLFLFHILHS